MSGPGHFSSKAVKVRTFDNLPNGPERSPLQFDHFPTTYQAVLWRNWGICTVDALAKVLQASVQDINDSAKALGLPLGLQPNPCWNTRGYATIVRKNWHLLPYRQIGELLNWKPDEFLFKLKEDDFLWHKMGFVKPATPTVLYRPLNDKEAMETKKLQQIIRKRFPRNPSDNAFAFIRDLEKERPSPSFENCKSIDRSDCRIDSDWGLALSVDCSPDVRLFLARFRKKWHSDWNLTLDNASQSSRIEIVLRTDWNVRAESHELRVEKNRIHITAVDARGILRALQWIDDCMQARNAPAVPLGLLERIARNDIRMIYPYDLPYGDPLLKCSSLPRGLLQEYAAAGINAIWIHAVLYTLYPWSEAPELSRNHRVRLSNLQKLVRQAAEYGIDVILYLNEPRALPVSFFETKKHLMGVIRERAGERLGSLCTSVPEVQRYLKDAAAHVFRQVQGLKGAFTISMSENLTNCFSKGLDLGHSCSRCSGRGVADVLVEVNSFLCEGIKSASPNATFSVWSWGWRRVLKDQQTREIISRLPTGTCFIVTSEDGLPVHVGGVDAGPLVDYSMSQTGPSPWARAMMLHAKKHGLRTGAKVQINNSWECSAVSFLPVLDLVDRHLRDLAECQPDCLMLSWTLGGYPSPNLHLAKSFYFAAPAAGGEVSNVIDLCFPKEARKAARKAFEGFSRGFRKFPFHYGVLYRSPVNYGPMNLLWEEPTSYESTMVGFPYDDLAHWRATYPEDMFEEQFRKLCLFWAKALKHLAIAMDGKATGKEGSRWSSVIFLNAEAAYLHFYSTFQQIRFIRLRDKLKTVPRRCVKDIVLGIKACLEAEIGTAVRLESLLAKDSTLGFEGSNHYYYTWNDLREKVLNCEYLLRKYESRYPEIVFDPRAKTEIDIRARHANRRKETSTS